jgi:hypothetical protein
MSRRYPPGYAGDRPGRELSREYVERVVMPLIQAGWIYHKSNRDGRGKPRLIGPDGQRYSLPNTPTDCRSVKNAQADVRRLLRERRAA